ncbi:hypothetical protein MMC28_008431 [Mycoblastus sanguinarius]|nr:hypothetical protein [Mycoblastus sanguinarius]
MTLCAKSSNAVFKFMSLPIELRQEVYRQLFVDIANGIEVVSNYLNGGTPKSIRLYIIKPLGVMETSHQIQVESSEIFYFENVFKLFLYKSRPHWYCNGPFGLKTFHVDFSRVRKCHILNPGGYFPVSFNESLEATRLQYHLQYIADALSHGHSMSYMLIESYHFECAIFHGLDWRCSIEDMLEPLESVRGVPHVYIRTMKKGHWPYLRSLENVMMSQSSVPSRSENKDRAVILRALRCKKMAEILDDDSESIEEDEFGDPDGPRAHQKMFRALNTQLMYDNVDFLGQCEDDFAL